MSLSGVASDNQPNPHPLRRILNITSQDPVIDFTGHIDCGDYIMAGGSGTIYKGKWRNSRLNSFKVIVKVIGLPPIQNEAEKGRRFKLMKRELELWGRISHDNILPLVGIAQIDGDANRPAFLSPYMSNGNVVDFLKQNPNFPTHKLLKDIIEGLRYLHSFDPEIVHGDIKGTNILVTHGLEACLCDFGLSRFAVENTLWRTTATRAGGTLRWMAPELFSGDVCTPTKPSDIYAYGMTCYEILTGNVPFSQVHNEVALMNKVVNGVRPERVDSRFSDGIWSIITSCWSQEEQNRPTAKDVLALLQATTVQGDSGEGIGSVLSKSPTIIEHDKIAIVATPHDRDGERERERDRGMAAGIMGRARGFLRRTPPAAQSGTGGGSTIGKGSAARTSVGKAQAMYKYDGSPADPYEHTFTKGEVFEIIDRSGKWWEAINKEGKFGIIPSNYMRLIE